jgi:hypothetical protein
MTEAEIIWEYRQICQVEEDRSEADANEPVYVDESYEQELLGLGITPEMREQFKG